MSDESLKSGRFETNRVVRSVMEQTQRWEIGHHRCEFESLRWDIGDVRSKIGHWRCEFEM